MSASNENFLLDDGVDESDMEELVPPINNFDEDGHSSEHQGDVGKDPKDVICIDDDDSCDEIAESVSKIPCEICNIHFDSFDLYLAHYANVHKDSLADMSLHDIDSNLYTCRYCLEVFNDLNAYDMHCQTKHPHEVFLYRCPLCSKKFKLRQTRDAHLVMHDSARCPQCPKVFDNEAKLQSHFNKIHAKKYACRFCGQIFNVRWNRKRHERIHTTDSEFECELCKVKFSSKARLTIHMRSHKANEKVVNFKCPECNMKFPSAIALEEHLQTHEVEVAKKEEPEDTQIDTDQQEATWIEAVDPPYEQQDSRTTAAEDSDSFCCYSCGTLMNEFAKYRFHYQVCHPEMIAQDAFSPSEFIVKLPDELSCPYCLRVFGDKDIFHNHMQTSHTDKLYTCPLCPRDFRSKLYRARHIDIHFKGKYTPDTWS